MRNRRTTELLLLTAALPILVLLFAMYLINSNTPLTVSSFAVLIGLFVAFLISHLVIRKFTPNADPAILPVTFLLSGIGIIFVMRLAPDLAVKQVAWLYLSIAAMIAILVMVKSSGSLARYKYTIMLAGIVCLLLPALIGTEISGSKIWITVGGFSFQPGELAKVLIVIFLASYLAENRELLSISTRHVLGINFPDFKTLFPLLIMWIISLLIVVFERDLGSALLFFTIFLIMLYVATGRFSYVVIGVLLLAVGAVFSYNAFGHVQTRVEVWLDPFSSAQDQGYQLVQAIYSMADGGLTGVGIGRGLATKIPVVASDFIFAAIAEEMGLLGATAVLILYMLFTIRGFLIAARAKSDTGAFLAVGLTASISFQAFVIVGGVTRLIPLTGLTLPFMSQGGSSLLASFIIVGLLLVVSNEGTGVETEMTGVATLEGGVLGRHALGKRLTQLTVVFAVLFALLIANLTYIQVIRADYYKNLPTNNHTLAMSQRDRRGSIITADGVTLATSQLSDDGQTYDRVYPQGSMAAHLVGYYSLQYGSTGVENSANDYLVGNSGYSSWNDVINSYAGIPTTGDDVTLTLNSTVQQVAQEQLDGQTGAIVAIDPTTGAVLAMASSPTYDLNDVGSVISDTSGDALYNRATQALYAPGSSFKMVTLTAALEENMLTATTTYNSPASIDIGGAPITNFGDEGYGTITVQDATALSSNTVFAQIADQLGADKLVSYSDKFGLDDADLGLDFNVTESLMPDPAQMTEWETAWAGVGQPVGEHSSPAGPQVTVTQMALIGSALANGGELMKPYVIDHVSNSNGTTVTTTTPEKYGRVCSATTASEAMDILTYAVANGAASNAEIDGATVAGKTGTAQTGNAIDNAWFVGIAEANGKKVVVAVIIEQGGTGSSAAAPRAREVMAAALNSMGAL